ncbi:MAG: chromosomal replication initiator protein DnaA [Planctomycetes bacterium]|nr:chromosomal replication initiator protein DnaA [Planctomycetota bacterium]
MSATRAPAAWRAFLAQIRGKVSDQTFNTWFLPLQFGDVDDRRLLIDAPGDFFAEWIEEHFLSLLNEAALGAFGSALTIQFRVDASVETIAAGASSSGGAASGGTYAGGFYTGGVGSTTFPSEGPRDGDPSGSASPRHQPPHVFAMGPNSQGGPAFPDGQAASQAQIHGQDQVHGQDQAHRQNHFHGQNQSHQQGPAFPDHRAHPGRPEGPRQPGYPDDRRYSDDRERTNGGQPGMGRGSNSNGNRAPQGGSEERSGQNFTHSQGFHQAAGAYSNAGTVRPRLYPDNSAIDSRYSFETFVVGPSNQLTHAACMAVAERPAYSYNPLFIYGGVGLGKTHLMHSIGNRLKQRNPSTRIFYLSSEQFMNEMIESIQRNRTIEFKNKYRNADLLLIDDIQFLAGKESTQEEFFHTFNALYQSQRQIVLSSDSPPAEIPQLEERLVSRFQWGLVAQVSKPDVETRLAILRAKAKVRGIELPPEVIEYVANKIDSNARELEGALTTIQGHASLQNKAVDLALAQQALGESALHPIGSQVTLQSIINAVTAFFNVKLSDLQSKRRHKSITGPRQVCMWFARKRTRFSLEEIGGYFGGRDHTTVMHSIRIVDERSEADPSFKAQIDKLEQTIDRAIDAS